jgi:ubiquinone/menaquinone biosynthesis C-methylase UbiE
MSSRQPTVPSGSVERESRRELSAADANRRYYATRAGDYDQTEECVTLERHRRRLRRILDVALASVRHPERILDACGGSGHASLELWSMGVTPMTVDISPEMLELYTRKALAAGYVAKTEVCEIGSFLAKTSDEWDLIVFSSALHHLDDYRSVLLAASGRLAPGGVIATVFDPISLGRLGQVCRYIDYLLWVALTQPLTFVDRLRRQVARPATSTAQVGRIAERHALSGIDDIALARRLEDSGLEVLLHERGFEARFLPVRMALRLLTQPSTFSFVFRRPV